MPADVLARVLECVARCAEGPGDVARVRCTCKMMLQQVAANGWTDLPPPTRWAFDLAAAEAYMSPAVAGSRLEADETEDGPSVLTTWLLEVRDTLGKPCFKLGYDDTDIRECLSIFKFRFVGDCHFLSAFPGLVTHSYTYDYRTLEAQYRAIALPLDAARTQLTSLEGREPGPVQDAALSRLLTEFMAVRKYMLSVQHTFAKQTAAAEEKLARRKAKYEGNHATRGQAEFTTQEHAELHYLGEVVARVSSLGRRSDSFCAEVEALVNVVDVTLGVLVDVGGVGVGGRVSLTLRVKPVAGVAEVVRAATASLSVVFELLEDAFFLQRRAASKLLSIRLMDSSKYVSTSVARVTHAGAAPKPSNEDFRDLICHVTSLLRQISRDTIEIGVVSFDGEFRSLWHLGCTRPTTALQLARQCQEEAKALEAQARLRAGLSPRSKNLSANNKVRVKWGLVRAVQPLVQFSHRRRSPTGVNLHAVPAGDARDALEAKTDMSIAELLALLRSQHRGTSFEEHMKHRGCFPADGVDLAAELIAAGIVEAGTPLPASAALTAFQLHHAVADETVSIKLLMVEIEQLLFEGHSAALADKGVDFSRRFFVPEVHPVFGVPVDYHEDCYHKDKCLRNAVCADKSVQRDDGPAGMLVRKAEVLQAVQDVPGLSHIAAILSHSADSQNVVCALEFLQSPALQRRLAELGSWSAAGALKVFGHGSQAFSSEGISRETRRQYLVDEASLIKALFGERLGVVELLTAGDVARGFPRDLLLSRLGNICSHQWWEQLHPDLIHALVDLFFSTDDVELEWSMLVRIARGYKPQAQIALGVLRNADVLSNAKLKCDGNIIVAASTKSNYVHAERRAGVDERWNDPDLLERAGPGQDKYNHKLTADSSAVVRAYRSIRSFHDNK